MTGNRSPTLISSQAMDSTTPYYALGDDRDNPERPFSILDSVIGKALKRSGLHPDEVEHMGLFMGSSSYDLRSSELAFQQQLEAKQPDAFPVKYSGSSRLSDWVGDRFNITGDAFNINTACTSSANALLLARQMLNQGIFRHALVIGIELFNETTLGGFSGLQLLATEHISPFDKQRDGLLLGEGCAAVVLGSDDHDSPFWLVGGGTSFDPHSITAANEEGASIADAILSALNDSGMTQSDIVAIKAQGSGSHINDLAESRGLQRAFRTVNPAIFNSRHSKVGDVPGWRGVGSRDAAVKPPPYMDAQVSREAGSRKRPGMDSRRPHQPGTSPTHTDPANGSVNKIPPVTAIKP
ncbi:MAG: beta-ketoacyl synthase N-terminal-like domain-containing protein, partial [Pseudomonadota bacterium]